MRNEQTADFHRRFFYVAIQCFTHCHSKRAVFSKKKGERRISPLSAEVNVVLLHRRLSTMLPLLQKLPIFGIINVLQLIAIDCIYNFFLAENDTMSEAKVRGVVHLIEETKTFGQKGFRKRTVVLEQDNGRFPQHIPIDFVRDACESVDDLSVGDEVEIAYSLGGRRWQRDPQSEVKFFLSAEAISFKKLSASDKAAGGNEQKQDTADPNDAFAESYDEGDIPF
jgi:hypothetical protein